MRLVSLYTIPHTGTRFVSNYLRHIGANYSRRHAGDTPPCPEGPLIVTVRHPYAVYMSHRYSYPEQTDAEFIRLYDLFFAEIKYKEAFYFPLDTKDREGTLKALAEYAWCDHKDFPWEPVGRTKRDRTLPVPEHMKEALQAARSWYKLHT